MSEPFFPFVADVEWFDSWNDTIKHTYHPIYAPTITEAMRIIDEQYKGILESVHIAYVDDQNTLFEITKEQAETYTTKGAYKC